MFHFHLHDVVPVGDRGAPRGKSADIVFFACLQSSIISVAGGSGHHVAVDKQLYSSRNQSPEIIMLPCLVGIERASRFLRIITTYYTHQ